MQNTAERTESAQVTLSQDAFVLPYAWTDKELEEIKARIEAEKIFEYYQQIVLQDAAGKQVATPGHNIVHRVLEHFDATGFPKSFEGLTVLDIGCNAGFYSFVAKLRGAKRVVGVDHQRHYIGHAKLVRELMGFSDDEVEFYVGDGHDISPGGETFDFVINTGVAYHLKNPVDFLERVASITSGQMYLESEILLDDSMTDYAWFIEKEYGGDPSNWWIYGPNCLARMARAAGFKEAEFQGFIWKAPPGMQTVEGFQRQGRGTFLCTK